MKKDTVAEIKQELRRMENEDKAKVLRRYFKTGKGEYAEGDIFLGLTSLQIKDVAKKYYFLSVKEIGELLTSRIHSERMCALRILLLKLKKADEKTKKEIFDLYLANTRFINNWDLVDISAPQIVGAYLEDKRNEREKNLFRLAKSKNLWERRIAMIATFYFIKKGNSGLALDIAAILISDAHDLIHKAVGWMLREIGKNCGQEIEEEFLKKHYKTMPRVTLRYAIERFSEEKRKYYLNLK